MAGKLAPGRQSDHGVNISAGVRYQIAGFAGLLPRVPRGRRVVTDAVGTKAG